MKKNYLLLLLFCLLGTWLSASATQKTIFFDNSSRQWAQPYVYLYQGSSSEVEEAMTRLGNSNIWCYTKDTDHKAVIFKKAAGNDGEAWSGQVGKDGNPTLDDLTLYDENATKYANAPKLQGSWNGSSSWSDLDLTYVSGAVYKTATQTYPSTGSVKFGFRIVKGSSGHTWFNLNGTALSVDGATAPLTNSGSNSSISLPAGTKYHLEVDFSNIENAVKLVVEQEEQAGTTAKVIGFVTSTTWDSNGVSLTDNGDGTASGQFTLHDEYFRINVNGSEYGPSTDGTAITLGTAMPYSAQTSNSWKLSTGTYNIVVDNNNKTVTVTSSSTPTPTPTAYYRLKTSEDNWGKYYSFTDKGDGTYELSLENPAKGLEMMVQNSSDGNNYFDFCWPSSEDKNYPGGDKTFTMSGEYGSNVIFGAGLTGTYTLTLTPNTTDSKQSTLKISGNAVVVTTYDDVYLRGSNPLSWSENKAEYKFSTTDGKIYTLTGVNLGSGVIMKVYNSTTETWYGYVDGKVTGPAEGVDDGQNQGTNNIKLTETLSDATITLDVTDPSNWKITIANTMSVYLRGDFTDPQWTDNAAYKFSTADNVTYVLEHVNIDNGKLLKVYYGGKYYGHDSTKVTGPVSAVDDGQGGYNMKLTEQLKDATITFTMPTPYADNWTLTIVNGAEVEHTPYYFAGDMNRWYSKEFEGDQSAKGIDPEIFAAEKGKWQFEYVGEVEGQTEKGWYKYVFDKNKIGMSTLVGQFQIIDDSGWSGSQYSHNPKTNDYGDASGFARYICRPITREMISNGTVMTKETSAGKPGIKQQAGSNFHLDCNGVNNAVIYFLPGSDPKMIVKGDPTDYFIFYSANGKTGGDNAVSMKIVNGKPNENNYYLPGVKNLKNYTSEDAKTTAEHMNIAAVTPTLIDFSNDNFESDTNFTKVFGNSNNVGDLTLDAFVNKIKTDKQLPNGISLNDREEVYVIKIPNGFEYAAGTKFAVTFEKAFAAAEKTTATSIVANHLYFFNDQLHVLLNVDNYEAGAQNENAYVKLYYRVYGYDSSYNTIVVKSDGTTETLYEKGAQIGLTADGDNTQKNTGWVEYNNYGVPSSLSSYTGSDKWHYATDNAGQFVGIEPKYGNFFVQFKIVTGPNASAAPANGPAKVVDKEYTLYLPEKTLALNQEGFYNFNGQDIYQKFDGGYTTTDVEDVFEDQIVEEGVDAEPIFFNLQGQRVVNPEKGLYIVVKGNKTYKVMIK